MKILFDTNFLNAYNSCSDQSIKRKIKNLVEKNKLQFFLSDILIFEWLAIFDTSHQELLSEYAKIFIDLKANVCFKQIQKILNSEIGVIQSFDYLGPLKKYFVSFWTKIISSKTINAFLRKLPYLLHLNMFCKWLYFENPKTLRKLQDKFKNLAKGHVFVNPDQINSILNSLREYREQWFSPQASDIARRNDYMRNNKPLRRHALRYDFDNIYNSTPVFNQRINWVYQHFNFGQSKEIIPKNIVEKCLTDSRNFPYINTWVRTRWAFQYLYVISERRVDENDLFDSYQLIYATNLDHFVTDEKRLKLISEMVFQNKEKTLSFKEFCLKIEKI